MKSTGDKKKALLLDAGGTLLFANFRKIAEELNRDGIKVTPELLRRVDSQVRFELDLPEIVKTSTDSQRWKLYFENLFRLAGISKIPMEAFKRLKAYHETHNLWDFVPEDIPKALEILSARFRLGIVSNANGTVRMLFSRVGLADYFETVVDSHEEGIEKPDPRLFEIALKRMDLKAPDTAYVGDLYHIDVMGARAAGLTPFLLDPLDLYGNKPVNRIKFLHEIAERF